MVMRYQKVRIFSGKGSGPDRFAGSLRGLATDAADRLFAVGDSAVKVFSAEGLLKQHWRTGLPGYCVTVAEDGRVFVGQAGQLEIFAANGERLDTWRDADRLGLVTAIGLTGDAVVLADVKDRCLRRYDTSGKFLNNIGKDTPRKGFLVPNRHLDFAIDSTGTIHAANPGKHRVERYTLDGKLLGHFGRFGGTDPAGFGGCCNPTNLTLMRDGRVVVTEKAAPRVKIYDAAGKLLAVMGEDDFDPACKNMDVAVDSKGRIYVGDTARLHICVFAPTSADADLGPATANQPVKP